MESGVRKMWELSLGDKDWGIAVLLRGLGRKFRNREIDLEERSFWAEPLVDGVEGTELGNWLRGQVPGGEMTRLLAILKGEEGRLDGTSRRG